MRVLGPRSLQVKLSDGKIVRRHLDHVRSRTELLVKQDQPTVILLPPMDNTPDLPTPNSTSTDTDSTPTKTDTPPTDGHQFHPMMFADLLVSEIPLIVIHPDVSKLRGEEM